MRDDKEMNEFLAQVDMPAHSPDLADRIIARAMTQGQAGRQTDAIVQVKQGRSFGEWWGDMKAHHGQKMAIAAALAFISVIVFDPAGKVTQHYIDEQQLAQAEADPYTVDGLPLLVDVALVEEPDLDMEEVVAFGSS